MSASNEHAFAVVESVETDGLRLKFDGEETAGEKRYKCNTFYVFHPGDRVYCVRDSGSYVAICVIGAPAPKLDIDVDNVETAKNAETAAALQSMSAPNQKIEFWFDNNGQLWSSGEVYPNNTLWPVMAAFDSNAITGTKRYILFRSTSDGGLEYQAPYRSYTWKKLANG